ncbi:MAG: TolC family protein [Bacteroidia bacterium]
MRSISFILFFFFTGIGVNAQRILSLQQAIEIALKNNYTITIAKNDASIAANDVTPGNAGALPTLDLGLIQNNSNNDSKQSYSNGTDVNKTGAKAHSLNADALLSWTIFDGFKMFATYNKLEELSAMGELNARVTIEETVNQVINSYFEIVRMKALIDVTQNALDVSQLKLSIAKTKFEIGSTSKVEYLQATIDRNADSSSLLLQQQSIDNSKVRLNELLARDLDANYDVDTAIEITFNSSLDELKTIAEKENTSLLLAQKDVSISNYYIKELQGSRYPRIGLNGSYVYSKANSEASFILDSRTSGFNYGFSVTYNLFNGFNLNRNIKNARIMSDNAMVNYTAAKADVNSNLIIAYRVFKNNLQLLALEQSNSLLATENLNLALERFRAGSIDELQLKDAQQSNVEAQNRLVNAKFVAKVSEVYLKRISGQLLK